MTRWIFTKRFSLCTTLWFWSKLSLHDVHAQLGLYGGAARLIWVCKPIFMSNPTGVRLGYVVWGWSWVGVVTILFFWNDYILLYQAIPTKPNQTKPNRTRVRGRCPHLHLKCIFTPNNCAYSNSAMSMLPGPRFRVCGGAARLIWWSSMAYMVVHTNIRVKPNWS